MFKVIERPEVIEVVGPENENGVRQVVCSLSTGNKYFWGHKICDILNSSDLGGKNYDDLARIIGNEKISS